MRLASPDEEYLRSLDQTILDVEGWILRAGSALLTFWDGQRRNFIRETVAADATGQLVVGRVSTNRCLSSLVEYLYCCEEMDLPPTADRDSVTHNLARADEYLRALAAETVAELARSPESVRHSVGDTPDLFTDAHIALAATAVESRLRPAQRDSGPLLAPVNADWPGVRTNVLSFMSDDCELVGQWLGGKIHERDVVHDFVTLHFICALDCL